MFVKSPNFSLNFECSVQPRYFFVDQLFPYLKFVWIFCWMFNLLFMSKSWREGKYDKINWKLNQRHCSKIYKFCFESQKFMWTAIYVEVYKNIPDMFNVSCPNFPILQFHNFPKTFMIISWFFWVSF